MKTLASLHSRHTCVRLLTRFEPTQLLEKLRRPAAVPSSLRSRHTAAPLFEQVSLLQSRATTLAATRRRRSPGRTDDRFPCGAVNPAVQKLSAAAYLTFATRGPGGRRFVTVSGGGWGWGAVGRPGASFADAAPRRATPKGCLGGLTGEAPRGKSKTPCSRRSGGLSHIPREAQKTQLRWGSTAGVLDILQSDSLSLQRREKGFGYFLQVDELLGRTSGGSRSHRYAAGSCSSGARRLAPVRHRIGC